MKGVKLIYESSHSLIYLQANEGVQQRIIKVARNTLPADQQVFYLQREFLFTQKLNHISGVRNVLEETTLNNQYAILLEYIPGKSLKDAFVLQKKPLIEVVEILIYISEILSQIHECHIIHKDLTSKNILISENTQGNYSVHLIDFALAANQEESERFEQKQGLWAKEVEQAGTWAYMAPEQTGRVNRKIDHRTDLYALGINLYEMLTCRHPFLANDPIEWVHAHLAQAPVYPAEYNSQIPESISDICMKLLEKNPANRYESATALRDDLYYIQNNLTEQSPSFSFTPGKHHLVEKLDIPVHFYNREVEIAQLQSQWQKVINGSTEIVLLSGYAGTGKTRFARQLKSQLSTGSGYFLEGKFDALTQNKPYSAWLQAFDSFINQILVEKSSQLEIWKATLQQALGSNARLLTDLLPKLELIIGKPAEITSIGIQEAQNRLIYVFRRFVDAISIAEHPLIVLIDDWQWADAASVELLKILSNYEENDYFLIICAYRETEVSGNLPVSQVFDELLKKQNGTSKIGLTNWSRSILTNFIQDTLHCSLEFCSPLAKIIYQKTQGNPFFAIQMLTTLYDKNLLIPHGNGEWEYDTEGIKKLTISENVATFLSSNIQGLNKDHQQILQTAACIGEFFSINILKHLINLPYPTLVENLNQLVDESLLIPLEKSFRFAHDRLRVVFYEGLDPSERSILHARIGLWMVSNLPTSEQEEQLFDIVNHLNVGKHLLKDGNWLQRYNFDQMRLVVLNLKAAIKSKTAFAWDNAQSYLETASQLLPSNSWDEAYEVTYSLYKEWSEVAFMSGNTNKALELSRYALKYTHDSLDQAYLYNIQVIFYNSRETYRKAYYVGKEALRKLGFAIRDAGAEPMLEAKKRTIHNLIEGKSIEELENSLPIQNPYIQFALKILTNLEYAAFHDFPKIVWSIIVHKAIYLCLTYGRIPEAAYIYTSYGYLLIIETSDHQKGFHFGSLGMKLSHQHEQPSLKAKVCARYGAYIMPWVKPLQQALPILEEGIYNGMEGGELRVAGENFTHTLVIQFMLGTSLPKISKKLHEQQSFIERINMYPTYVILQRIQAVIQSISQSETNKLSQEKSVVEYIEASPNTYQIISTIFKFIEIYYCENECSEHALLIGQYINAHLHQIKGRIEVAIFRFYYALLLCESFSEVLPSERNRRIQEIMEQQSHFQHWTKQVPQNFKHFYTLIYAELNRIRGNKWEASELYDQAISESRQLGFLHIEALCNELAGKYWLGIGKQEFAKSYLQKAAFLYDKWGSKLCAHRLQESFPQFFHIQSTQQDTTSSTADIDQLTLLQASQTLSGEIVLSNLLEKLMRIVIANAGAVHGAFFTLNGQSLILRAEGDLRAGIDVSRTIPLSHSQTVPQSVILYVFRTQQELVLIDASREEPYNSDPYIAKKDQLSIACLPVMYKDQLSAIIYLENDLITGAFTNEQLEILRILSAQIAISLDNAALYENLEEKVAERTTELDDKNRALGKTLEKLKQAQAQLVDAAKMASLGQLTAGIAHEINNPLNFISANIKPLRLDFEDLKSLYAGFTALKYVEDKETALQEVFSHAEEIDTDFLFQEMENLLHGIEEGALRTKKIVEGLKTFSFGGKETFQNVNIHEGIDATLMLLTNKWKERIEIQKNYDPELSYVSCMPGKLNQVFMNIIQNAILALEDRIAIEPNHIGVIDIYTKSKAQHVVIGIKDNGIGMKKEVLTRIFEPFFTTRDVGVGTGLGLSITFGIIEQHNGKIEVQSKWMKGSEFIITLPLD